MCLLTDYGTSTKEDTCRFQESIDRHAITKTQGPLSMLLVLLTLVCSLVY